MSIYDSQIKLAERLITEKGVAITIRRYTSDAGTGYQSFTSEETNYIDYSTYAVRLPATGGKVQAFDIRAIDPNLNINELEFLLTKARGLAITPRPDDEVSFDGVNFMKVLGNTPLQPDGTPIIHGLSIRK